jgi:hypothetical protein
MKKIAFVALYIMTGCILYSQSTIKGEVKIIDGDQIPHILLLLKQNNRVVNGAYTDSLGFYIIFGVQAGRYDISIGGTIKCPTVFTERGIYVSNSEVKIENFAIYCFNDPDFPKVPTVSSKEITDTENDTTYVKTEYYEGIIFGKNYPKDHIGIDINKRWNPTIEDITIAEKIIKDYFEEYCEKYKKERIIYNPNICEHASDYIRQYVGRYDTEDRILVIYGFWKEYLKNWNWKTHRVNVVLGGETAYWFMKIDMDKRKVIDFFMEL